MKNAFLILIAASLAFSCQDKELKPQPAQKDNFTLNGYFTLDGDASDSNGKLQAAITDVSFGPKTALFNGTSSFIQIPSTGSFAAADQLTVSLFFKPTDYNEAQNPRLLQMTDESGNAVEIFVENSRVHLSLWDESKKGDAVKILTPNSPYLGKWNKVVATVDFANNSMSLYVNDELVQTVSDVDLPKLGKSTIVLGRHQHLGGNAEDFFHGELDNVRIDNTILTPADFSQFGQ